MLKKTLSALATGLMALLAGTSVETAQAQLSLDTQLVANGLARQVFVTAPVGDFSRIFIVEQRSGRLEAALEHYRHSARIDPGNATVHYKIAMLYKSLGRKEQAKTELDKFRQLKAAQPAMSLRRKLSARP